LNDNEKIILAAKLSKKMENSKEKGLPLFLFFKNRKKNLPFPKTICIFAAQTIRIEK